ncbi:MAG: hypothetical protein GY730_12035 [bacterium]|nr:hypothetical protein [bacterium]
MANIGIVSLNELKNTFRDSFNSKKVYLNICLNVEDGEYKTHLINVYDDPNEDKKIRDLALSFLLRRHIDLENIIGDRYSFEILKRFYWKDEYGKKEFIKHCYRINNELSKEYLFCIINDKDETREIRDLATIVRKKLEKS